MRAGGGKQKGAAFERKICVWLSKLVSKGKRKDIFWRSAMSGGRATIMHQRGVKNQSQVGDISAVDSMGAPFLGIVSVECKHVKDFKFARAILFGKSPLCQYWRQACRDAASVGRQPMLIARDKSTPILVLTTSSAMLQLGIADLVAKARPDWPGRPIILLQSQIKKLDL